MGNRFPDEGFVDLVAALRLRATKSSPPLSGEALASTLGRREVSPFLTFGIVEPLRRFEPVFEETAPRTIGMAELSACSRRGRETSAGRIVSCCRSEAS
jgi:hypothetical protein